MNKFAFALLLAAAPVLPAQSRADMVDMSTITCAQLATMSDEDGGMFLIWLDGWLAGQSDARRWMSMSSRRRSTALPMNARLLRNCP
jgi:hypothetical protein